MFRDFDTCSHISFMIVKEKLFASQVTKRMTDDFDIYIATCRCDPIHPNTSVRLPAMFVAKIHGYA
jgi:5'(3')-deoxyribonucleotidase